MECLSALFASTRLAYLTQGYSYTCLLLSFLQNTFASLGDNRGAWLSITQDAPEASLSVYVLSTGFGHDGSISSMEQSTFL